MSNQIAVVMTGDDSRLLKAFQRSEKAQEKQEQGFKKTKRTAEETGKSFEQAGKSHEKSFGAAAAQQLVTYAAGFASIQGGIQLVTNAFRQLKQDQDAALTSTRSIFEEMRRLNQVATDAKDLQQLNQRSDALAAQHGVDRAAVRRVMFSARSEGFESAVPQIIAASQVFNPEAQATVAGQVPGLLPGSNLSPIEAIDMTAAAGRQSRLNFEQMAAGLPISAEGGAVLGASAEEIMATHSVLASRFKSGETAGDRMKAISIKMGISEDPRLQGRGLLGGFAALRDEFSDEERGKFLGDSTELNAVYKILGEEFERIKQIQDKVTAARAASGTADSELAQGIARASSDPAMVALKEVAKSDIALELDNERVHLEGGATSHVATNFVKKRLKSRGAINQYIGNAAAGIADVFSDDAGVIAGVGVGAAEMLPGGRASNPFQWNKLFEDVGNDLKAASQDLTASAANLNQTTRSRTSAQRSEAAMNRE